MQKTTKVNSDEYKNKFIQDKTDWKRVYQKTQTQVDHEAQIDKDNPIVKFGKVRRLNDVS
jgi:hypothetical protein